MFILLGMLAFCGSFFHHYKVESRFTHFLFPLRVWHCCILRKGLRGEVARVSKEPEAVSYWKEGA